MKTPTLILLIILSCLAQAHDDTAMREEEQMQESVEEPASDGSVELPALSKEEIAGRQQAVQRWFPFGATLIDTSGLVTTGDFIQVLKFGSPWEDILACGGTNGAAVDSNAHLITSALRAHLENNPSAQNEYRRAMDEVANTALETAIDRYGHTGDRGFLDDIVARYPLTQASLRAMHFLLTSLLDHGAGNLAAYYVERAIMDGQIIGPDPDFEDEAIWLRYALLLESTKSALAPDALAIHDRLARSENLDGEARRTEWRSAFSRLAMEGQMDWLSASYSPEYFEAHLRVQRHRGFELPFGLAERQECEVLAGLESGYPWTIKVPDSQGNDEVDEFGNFFQDLAAAAHATIKKPDGSSYATPKEAIQAFVDGTHGELPKGFSEFLRGLLDSLIRPLISVDPSRLNGKKPPIPGSRGLGQPLPALAPFEPYFLNVATTGTPERAAAAVRILAQLPMSERLREFTLNEMQQEKLIKTQEIAMMAGAALADPAAGDEFRREMREHLRRHYEQAAEPAMRRALGFALTRDTALTQETIEYFTRRALNEPEERMDAVAHIGQALHVHELAELPQLSDEVLRPTAEALMGFYNDEDYKGLSGLKKALMSLMLYTAQSGTATQLGAEVDDFIQSHQWAEKPTRK